jgi:RNA polymerase primary sigma factor/RNA polymerase sigma factor
MLRSREILKMNNEYRIALLRELRDQQVRFAPRTKRIEQANKAEQLLSELEPSREYPFEFLFYRVTDVRPDENARKLIKGTDAAHDLRLFVEDITDSTNIRVDELAEPIHTVEDLSKMFNVSTKTISRWRDRGLVSRRFVAEGRKRVGFLHSSVERFVAKNRQRVRRGERFSQMNDDERSDMIDRARRLASENLSLSAVARRLGREMGRSTETVRYTLKNFDRQNPQMAVFPDQRPTLSTDDQRAIYQQHRRGVSLVILAKRYGRTRSSVVRILNEQRATRIYELALDYMHNDDFTKKSMAAEILGAMPQPTVAARKVRAPSGLPAYLASLYDVALLTRDPKAPLIALMDEIESLYEKSVEVKNQIVQSNLRLVVSIAKRHVNGNEDFFGLISDGNVSLIRAAEKFDYSRGNKFSTYATWAIMKNFARTIPDEFRHRDRFRTSGEEAFVSHEDNRADNFAMEIAQQNRQVQINRILHKLDQREQEIIIRRFGLGESLEPSTLKEVGEAMGVTKERIRQIEARALDKLRVAAKEEHIDAPE